MDLSSLSRAELVDQLLRPRLVAEERSEPPSVERPSVYPAGGSDPVAHQLGVARELLLRDLRAQMQRGPVMDSPQVLRDWLRLHCAGLGHEVFIALYLTAHHALIEAAPIFRGTLTQTSVYPREVVKLALSHNAAAVAFAHNHPSGSPEPSRADEFLTQNLKSALALVDVRVLDHFVVSGDQLVSFAERGLL
jgi:DNA repair protein RadC